MHHSPTIRRHVILRDDDTCALTPPACLERLYRPFLDRGLPVSLATIPCVRSDARRADGRPEGFLHGGFEPRGRRLWIGRNTPLLGYLRDNPGYRIVQHGCDHTLYEFESHDRRDVARRLSKGATLLAEAGLGRPCCFVAPYDRLSRESMQELARRFSVISTGWFEWSRLPRTWWPANLARRLRRRPHWRAGGAHLLSHPGCLLSAARPRADMLARVRDAIHRSRLTVLVTHWWEFFPDGQPDGGLIDILHQVAEELAAAPDVRVTDFEAVARGEVGI